MYLLLIKKYEKLSPIESYMYYEIQNPTWMPVMSLRLKCFLFFSPSLGKFFKFIDLVECIFYSFGIYAFFLLWAHERASSSMKNNLNNNFFLKIQNYKILNFPTYD